MNDTPSLLWTPSPGRLARAGITRYRRWLADTHGRRFDDYESLWEWSVADPEGFWASIWDFGGVKAHSPYSRVLGNAEMPHAQWFEGATLNYAEHLLAHAQSPDAAAQPAIVFRDESGARTELSWAQLAAQAGALAATLRRLGVRRGDRVAAYLPNIPETVVALLAVTSVGAVWSSSSPDMGAASVLDRYRQIEPKALIAVDGYRYGGKAYDRRDSVRELVGNLPTVEQVILVPRLDPALRMEAIECAAAASPAGDGRGAPAGAAAAAPGMAARRVPVTTYQDAIAHPAAPEFEPVPFDHPLWIVYSSGTTGMPKPIVHGHGGTVVETLKSRLLSLDLGPEDRVFWFTSTNWIMWNFLVSCLMTGSTILQFDGNPGWPDLDTLWRFAADERATFFGTSPAFISLNMKTDTKPRERFDLSALRTLGCTGSPLTEEGYRWIYENVHPDILLAAISGGTDPGTAFLDASPMLPVYAGEMQCRSLGVAVHAYDDAGQPVLGKVGELVCAKAIPSMPLYFWNDPDGRRYFESYFDTFPGPPNVWRHGDWLELRRRPESVTGIIYGRSDSTINRHGIRMGTSEIYRVVEDFPEVLDSLVIDLEYLGRPSFMALFVVLRDPASGLPDALKKSMLDAIRTRCSARHVPDDVFVIPEVPRTISGKKMEVPVKKILLGQPVEKAANRDSMGNPGSLDWFVEFARTRA
jgi:acetoacetyl-CoA synthetase